MGNHRCEYYIISKIASDNYRLHIKNYILKSVLHVFEQKIVFIIIHGQIILNATNESMNVASPSSIPEYFLQIH